MCNDRIKIVRTSEKLTRQEAANRIGVSLRSYVSYENDATKSGTIKYRFFLHELEMIHKVVEWFKDSKDTNLVYTSYNEKENKDVYMVAPRDDTGKSIAYYEKHEHRDRETIKMYDFVK